MIANPATPIGIQRRLQELGRIRLGDKGTKGQPQKLTKFRLTSASRPLLEAAARMYGGTVRAWQGAPDDGFWELYTETDALDIMVPPVMNAYSQLYEVWDAGGCALRCDGSWESIVGEPCSHDHENGTMPDGKPWVVTTRVSVILPKLPGLGTWRLETKGWNAAATMPAALDLLIQAGRTGWLPAILRLEQQSSKKKVNGRSQTFRYVVPVVDIIGFTFAELFAATGTEPMALGGDVPTPQQLPVGPSRPPRGTKVDRPQLGTPPALPAVSDFRKPEAPLAPAAPPTPAPAPVEPPEMAGGWVVQGDEAPTGATETAAEPQVASTSTPDENGAAAAAGEVEGEAREVPTGLTQDEFLAALAEAGIDKDYAVQEAKALFPDRPARTPLTPEQRSALLAVLTDEKAATAAAL